VGSLYGCVERFRRGVRPPIDEEILALFDLGQVPIEIEHLDLDVFK
jgi:hypothetical protein